MNKDCPSCGNSAPSYAVLCKVCQFNFKDHEKRFKFPIKMSIWLLLIGIIAVVVTRHLATTNIAKRYVLDVETQSIIIAESTKKGTSAERLAFSKVKQLEYIIDGPQEYMIAVKTNSDEQMILKTATSDLQRRAEEMANLSGFPLVVVDNRRKID